MGNDRSLKTLSGIEAMETAESVAQERIWKYKRRDGQRSSHLEEEEPGTRSLRHHVAFYLT